MQPHHSLRYPIKKTYIWYRDNFLEKPQHTISKFVTGSFDYYLGMVKLFIFLFFIAKTVYASYAVNIHDHTAIVF